MNFLEAFRFCRRVTAFVLNTIICWFLMEMCTLLRFWKPRIEHINFWLPFWARLNLWIFGIQVQRHGPYVDEGKVYPSLGTGGVGRIFVANHSSALDIPIIFTTAEAHCISRHDVAGWPLIGWGARRVGTLFVDRTSRKSGAGVLKEVEQALGKGEGVAMFPEGTVNSGDEVIPFRNGAFNSAKRAGSQIVPLGIAYGDDAAYYGDAYFVTHVKQIAVLSKLRVAVEIGEPLEMGDTPTVEFKDQAHDIVQDLVNRARARLESS